MKNIEVAKKLFPELSEGDILKKCPVEFGLLTVACETFCNSCYDCWHREVLDYIMKKFPDFKHV